MLRSAKLVWRFYRTAMLPFCLCLSVCLVLPVLRWGATTVPSLSLAKLLLYGVVIYFIADSKRNVFVYYTNLGLRRNTLLAWSCAYDYLLFGLLMLFAILWAHFVG
ncbi:MAG: hypothetical protein RRZ83_00065 [Alistipes sp.]